MAFASVDNAQLAWQQLGEGPDLVLVHGLATNRAFWFGHAMRLSQRFRVTLFDLRGHGYSSTPEHGYEIRRLGADILGLMDQLSIPQAALIGHSYGGAAAIEAAVQAPERVTAMAVLDARSLLFQPQMWLHEAPDLSPFEAEIAQGTEVDWPREPQVGLRFLEVAARRCLAGQAPGARDPVTPFGEGRGARKAARQWLNLIEQTTAWDDFHRQGADIPALRSLSQPTLLMYADGSRCLKSGEGLRNLWPAARFQLLEGAAHFFPLTHAEQVVHQLFDFLAPLTLTEA